MLNNVLKVVWFPWKVMDKPKNKEIINLSKLTILCDPIVCLPDNHTSQLTTISGVLCCITDPSLAVKKSHLILV